MSPIQRIREAIAYAKADGIKIEAGACIDWVHGSWPNQCAKDKPRAVSWSGAVLWAHRQDPPDFSFARLRTLLSMPDAFWFHRFTIGFDQGRVLSILDPKTSLEIAKDEVSVLGVQLAKEVGARRR